MKVLIIEDEKSAGENLKLLLSEIDDTIQVETIIDSVKEAISYFSGEYSTELVFMDIHLADGNAFEIFEKARINIPIIFTTAYDEYAIKAFKVNSIDYLLKPIYEEELKEALEKFNATRPLFSPTGQFLEMLQLLRAQKKIFRTTYLVQQRDTLIPLQVEEVAYFAVDDGLVKAVTMEKKKFILDQKLEDIENELDPQQFFRVNRQFVVQRKAIENLQLYFNGKLILNIHPAPSEQIVVSKVKAPKLKKWIN